MMGSLDEEQHTHGFSSLMAFLSAAKIKASQLRTKQKAELTKQLDELKKELSEVRPSQEEWGWASIYAMAWGSSAAVGCP
jgi:translation initiation factor 2B subunit (eIF-2B alpha/beta/delta family)